MAPIFAYVNVPQSWPVVKVSAFDHPERMEGRRPDFTDTDIKRHH
jgi:hypothetical protein